MKKASLKSIIAVIALFIALGSLSSCNRGYGCPTNFSMDQSAVQAVGNTIQWLVRR